MLKVAMIMNIDTQSKLHFLDRSEMTCSHGLLCWILSLKNGSSTQKREPSCCVGYYVDILWQLREDIHIDFYIYEVVDGNYGSEVNGSWNGLVADVKSGKADIGAANLIVSKARQTVVDFTEPFIESGIVLACKVSILPLPYLNFETFASLSAYSWVSIFCLTLITGGIIYWAERLIYLPPKVENGCDVLSYALGLLFQRDIGGLLPKNIGGRVVSVALALTLMILMTTYTAVLTTRNIENRHTFLITGTKDPKVIQPTPHFKIATLKDSFVTHMLEISADTEWRNLGEFMRPYNYNDLAAAYQRLERGTLHAIFADRGDLQSRWKQNRNCDIQIVEDVYKLVAAFALKKGSIWNEVISTQIRKYKRDGVLDRIWEKYRAQHCKQQTEAQPNQFVLLYLSGACILLVMGTIFSGLLFVLEHVMSLCRKRFGRNRHDHA